MSIIHKIIKKGDSVIVGTKTGTVVQASYGTVCVRWYPLIPRQWSNYSFSQIDAKIEQGYLEIRHP